MTKKELRERLYQYWKNETSGLVITEVWQKRPNTAACVKIAGFIGFGFAKVAHPDEWNCQYGTRLAVKKAIASIVKHLLTDECESIEALLPARE